ncbi:MAG: hypothetical protein ACO2ZM_06145 [Francisellaceae bacterium]
MMMATVVLLSGCATTPPRNINNACAIVQQYPDWYYDSLASYKKWGVPISVQFAIIRKESSFIADAKPPMQYALGFIPVGRPTSAYGYAQAVDGTWSDYQKETGNGWASRSNFADAVDFIGWYGNMANRMAGVSRDNAYALYLAYYGGVGSYINRSYHADATVRGYANQTQKWAYTYARQLKNCQVPAKGWFW